MTKRARGAEGGGNAVRGVGQRPTFPDEEKQVIYPMTEVRGLQLARNDKAAASGLMTEARQDRSPAAGAASAACATEEWNLSVDVGHFPWATFPAHNRQCAVFKVLFEPFAPSAEGVP